MSAWTPGGFGGNIARYALELPGVTDATAVSAGLTWRSEAEGRVPVEAASVGAREFARVLGEEATGQDSAAIRALRQGKVVVAQTMARLWRVEAGDRMTFDGTRFEVAGIASDVATMGYEILFQKGPPLKTFGNRWFLIARVDRSERAARIKAVLRAYNRFEPLRVRVEGERAFLRQADAVVPQLALKEAFGEFVMTSVDGAAFGVDAGWRRNIVERDVPLLGSVTCHRKLIPQLDGAMRELAERGLHHLVDPSDFGGCYSPRFIGRDVFSGQLSHHAWGVAVDINAGRNPLGTESNQDPRLVRTMERWGFTWGGRWLVPDPMHFEWARFPGLG